MGLGNVKMSLNDVCVFIPAWFGAIASVVTGLLTKEVYGSWLAAALASLVMSVIPAHIMRSVGGGYDNESVAMTAMVLTFYMWCLSLKHHKEGAWLRPTVMGILTGLAYANMVAAWGGFIFVGNMVAVHAALVVALGYYSSTLRIAYTWFFIVGTAIAVQIPVVNWSPFRSAEQLGLLLVFVVLQVFGLVEYYSTSIKKLSWSTNYWDMYKIRVVVFAALAAAMVLFFMVTIPLGYFGGLSIRVRSLFIKHTKTGNPLVDSVAEHQPASVAAYWHYLNYASYLALPGLFLALINKRFPRVFFWATEEYLSGVHINKWFIIAYAFVAYYFSSRMQRLIILLGPVSSVLAGIALATAMEWSFAQGFEALGVDVTGNKYKGEKAQTTTASTPAKKEKAEETVTTTAAKSAVASPKSEAPKSAVEKARLAVASAAKSSGKKPATAGKATGSKYEEPPSLDAALASLKETSEHLYNKNPLVWAARLIFASGFLFFLLPKYGTIFYEFSDKFAQDMSQPSIMFKAKLRDGQEVMINDYVEGYHWLRDNTPADARVLSWWDYGYQITGIGNRTSLADGNTWNLEHIALLGRMLTSPEKRAWNLARHLADYVLIWAGNQGDDLSKSPHMARIGSSVYPDICPNDPLCRNFGFHSDRSPTPSMAASMLYKMHRHGLEANVRVNPAYFEDVFSSKYGLLRIFKILNVSQESRTWLANPANRLCDRPGSWYCPGQYPPGFKPPPKTHRNLDYDVSAC